MKTNHQPSGERRIAPATIEIELLALDLSTCTRCVGTLDHIEKAIEIVQPILEVMETRAKVQRIVVESEEQARRHQFATSPTVRINGKDITFETLESECQSCTDLCGCDHGTSCRVWHYRGEDYTEAPVGLVVESILREIFAGSRETVAEQPAYGGVPENLRSFFRGKSESSQPAETCCSPAEKEGCCEPEEKSTCCDDSKPAKCGCQ